MDVTIVDEVSSIFKEHDSLWLTSANTIHVNKKCGALRKARTSFRITDADQLSNDAEVCRSCTDDDLAQRVADIGIIDNAEMTDRLQEGEFESEDPDLVCPSCDNLVEEDWKRCVVCGEKLDENSFK